MPGEPDGTRSFITTPDDHGGIALTVCTLLSTWTVLCCGIRIFVRTDYFTRGASIGGDDVLCIVATVFATVQMALSSFAIFQGLGKSAELLSAAKELQVEKILYAVRLLYLLTVALTKCSVSVLLARLTPVKRHLIGCYALLIICALWGLVAFVAEATRCLPRQPWTLSNPGCKDFFLGWQAITAFNIITEILLAVVPVWIIWNLQTRFSRKAKVVFIFALRLPVVAAAAARLHFMAGALASEDVLLEGINAFICLQIEIHYGLLASTFPALRPFVQQFDTGWGTYDTQGITEYSMQSLGNKSKSVGEHSEPGANGSKRHKPGRDVTIGEARSVATAFASQHRTTSRSSNESQQMFIRRTVETDIEYDGSPLSSQHGR